VRAERQRARGWFRHEKLDVWHKAMGSTREVYKASAGFPAEERFGLTAQLRRAAVSVPSNVAEGAGRSTHAETVRFLEIAYGSLMEAVCQLRLASDLGWLPPDDHESLRQDAEEVARMLSGLRATRQQESANR